MLVIALAMILSFSRTPSFSPVSGLKPAALVMNGSVAVPVVLITLGATVRSISVPLTVIDAIWLTASTLSASSVASEPPTSPGRRPGAGSRSEPAGTRCGGRARSRPGRRRASAVRRCRGRRCGGCARWCGCWRARRR